MATQANLDAVQKLYIAYLGRAADQAGLNFWADAIESGVSTIESVATGFTLTAEYESIYGNLSNEALVEEIYQNTFGRASDADGKAFWVSQLASGAVTADTIALTMSNISGPADKALVDQKVVASNTYTQTAGANYDVTAGKAVLTDINNGGGTPTPTPTPTVNVINSTSAANSPVLTAGVDQFVTEFGKAAVAQVDTIVLTGTYEAGDTLTITGVTTTPLLVTVVDPNKVADEIVAVVNAASGKTVTAAISGSNVTLTADTSGTAFNLTVQPANKAAGADNTQAATKTLTTANKAAVIAGADTQTATTTTTTANKAAVAAGVDNTQSANSSITTPSDPTTAQVSTITLTNFEAGDTVSISGVTTNAVVVVVADPANLASDIAAAVTAATGRTVSAAVDGAQVVLTANDLDTPFTANLAASNKAAVDAVAQVNTIGLVNYEAGDTITISNVSNDTILVTVVNPLQVADEVAAAINNAPGTTVNAVVNGADVVLTAETAGTPFSVTMGTTNRAAEAAVAQVDTITLSGTYDVGDTVSISGVSTQPIIVTVTDPGNVANEIVAAVTGATGKTVNAAATSSTEITLTASTSGTPFTAAVVTANKAAGADTTQAASITHTTVNMAAAASLSTVANLDTLANFTVGTDKIHFTNLGVDVAAPTELTRVADITVNDLAADLALAFQNIGAGKAGLVKAGTDVYLFANDGNAAFSATQDVVIKLTGVALADQASGTTTVNAADYFA